MPREPVNQRDDLIVQTDGVGESQQGVAGRFCPHHEAAGGVIGVTEEKFGKETNYFLCVHVICIAERTVDI